MKTGLLQEKIQTEKSLQEDFKTFLIQKDKKTESESIENVSKEELVLEYSE